MSDSSFRLDVAVHEKYPNLSRSLIQRLIKNGYVTVNSLPVRKSGTLTRSTDHIDLDMSVLSSENSDSLTLDVLYEDENCVVVNKPAGVLTHSKGAFNNEATVASWLKQRDNYRFNADDDRGGIVHRLDRGTSGIIICAKNKPTLGLLQKQFQNRSVKKIYVAKIKGRLKTQQALIDLPIERNPKKPQTFRVGANGKSSQTEYKVLNEGEKYSLIELRPKTGRTHQLRVHLAYVKHPIVGDTFYGGESADRLYLHAVGLEITIPDGIRKVFKSSVPRSFKSDTSTK